MSKQQPVDIITLLDAMISSNKEVAGGDKVVAEGRKALVDQAREHLIFLDNGWMKQCTANDDAVKSKCLTYAEFFFPLMKKKDKQPFFQALNYAAGFDHTEELPTIYRRIGFKVKTTNRLMEQEAAAKAVITKGYHGKALRFVSEAVVYLKKDDGSDAEAITSLSSGVAALITYKQAKGEEFHIADAPKSEEDMKKNIDTYGKMLEEHYHRRQLFPILVGDYTSSEDFPLDFPLSAVRAGHPTPEKFVDKDLLLEELDVYKANIGDSINQFTDDNDDVSSEEDDDEETFVPGLVDDDEKSLASLV